VNNWHFFSVVLTGLINMVQGGSDTLINGSIGYVRPIVMAGVVAWIAAQSVAVAYANASIRTLYTGLFRAAVIVAALQSVGIYNQWIGDVAAALPNEIGNAIGGVGANITNGVAFDRTMNDSFKAGLIVWKHIPAYSFSGAILTLGVLGFWVISMMAVGAAALVYGASTVLLTLLIKLGPLFLAAFAFRQTARIGNGWASAIISAILTQVFSIAILVLAIGAIEVTLPQIVANASNGADPNNVTEMITLIETGFMLWVIWTLVKQAAGFASAIAGGVYQNVSAFTGAIGAVPSATVSAARGTAGVAGNAIAGTANAARSVSSAINQRRVNEIVRSI
jgi:type IV secretory pathway VirB6-like protein